jgi:hypothetical protein
VYYRFAHFLKLEDKLVLQSVWLSYCCAVDHAQVSDVSFVRDYMYGLSHLVAFLRTNFDGRVIWRLNPTVFSEILDEGRKQVFQESKIRLVARPFAA